MLSDFKNRLIFNVSLSSEVLSLLPLGLDAPSRRTNGSIPFFFSKTLEKADDGIVELLELVTALVVQLDKVQMIQQGISIDNHSHISKVKVLAPKYSSLFDVRSQSVYPHCAITDRTERGFLIGIRKFENIYKLQIGKFVYLYKAGLLPESFNNMFLLNCQVHPYNTRSSKPFHLPYSRTNIRKFSINFQGPNFLNTLSHQIQDTTSIASFTTMLKTFLLL